MIAIKTGRRGACQLQEPGQLTRKPTRNCRKHNCSGTAPSPRFYLISGCDSAPGDPKLWRQEREDGPHQHPRSPQRGPQSQQPPRSTATSSVCDTWARQTCRPTGLAARGFFGQFHKHTHSQAMFYSAIKPRDSEIAGDGITQEELIKGFV